MNEKYIQALRDVVQRTHGCACRYAGTVAVKETLDDKTVWDGPVAVFDLAGHPKASQAYAWSYQDDADKRQYATVLKVAPVDTPAKAVQAHVARRPRT